MTGQPSQQEPYGTLAPKRLKKEGPMHHSYALKDILGRHSESVRNGMDVYFVVCQKITCVASKFSLHFIYSSLIYSGSFFLK